MSETAGFIIILFCLALYFIPGICAMSRSHPATASIVILNLFLGWTLLFWAIALIWAAAPIDLTKKYR